MHDFAAPDEERKGTDLTYLSNHGGKPENTKPRQIFSPRRNIPSLAAAALVRGQAEDDYFLSISREHRKLSCVFHSTLGPLLLTSHCHCTALSVAVDLVVVVSIVHAEEGERRKETEADAEGERGRAPGGEGEREREELE